MKKPRAMIVCNKGELCLRLVYTSKRERNQFGYVDSNGHVQWEDPERVPKYIKNSVAPQLANEVLRKRLTSL